MSDLNEICLICNKRFKHLGSHIWHKHKIKAISYKEKFGLPHNLSLISEEVKIKKQIAFNKDREKYLKNILRGDSQKYRFKKGHNRHKKGVYFSKLEKENLIKRIDSNILKGICPICKTYFEHLQSHLYNKHKLLKVD